MGILRSSSVSEDLRYELIELREVGQQYDKHRYAKAIASLRRLREAYRRSDQPGAWTAYLAELRDRQKRKTSFLTKLDQAGLR